MRVATLGTQLPTASSFQDFLKNLDPHALAGVEDEAEFEDLMYQQSLCIQPREGLTADLRDFPSAEASMVRKA